MMQMFTSEQQEEFFTSKREEDESTTIGGNTYNFENFEHLNPNEKKQSVRIDGVNYQFKHIIRNYMATNKIYVGNSPRENQKNDRLTMHQVLSGKYAAQSTIKDGKMPSLDFGGFGSENRSKLISSPLQIMRNDVAADDNILSALAENDEDSPPRIITEQQMKTEENDAIFKFRYGTQIEIPPNFRPKNQIEYDHDELFYKVKYRREAKLFSRRFAGIFPRIFFDNIKSPDKNTIKKLLKEGALTTSNLRASSRRQLKRVSSNGDMETKNIMEIAALRELIISQTPQMEKDFIDYK